LPSICRPAFFAVDDWSGFRAQEPDLPPEALDVVEPAESVEPAALEDEAEVDAPEDPAEPVEPPDPDDEQAVRTRAVAAAATAAEARLGILMAPNGTSIT
jgi:hypothetical protein